MCYTHKYIELWELVVPLFLRNNVKRGEALSQILKLEG